MIVKEVNGMQGLFATQQYNINTILFVIEGEEIDFPTRTSIQINENTHVNVNAPLAFINHSCTPNIVVEEKKIKAIKSIEPGDEICFDYNQSEFDLANKFECDTCGQWIKGEKYAQDYPCLMQPNSSLYHLSEKQNI